MQICVVWSVKLNSLDTIDWIEELLNCKRFMICLMYSPTLCYFPSRFIICPHLSSMASFSGAIRLSRMSLSCLKIFLTTSPASFYFLRPSSSGYILPTIHSAQAIISRYLNFSTPILSSALYETYMALS